jgi:maltooligosyltrehalose trehalohydrolase
MPVAQFPGERNWGYDGVSPFSVQHSYGGPEGFKKLVDACHRERFAVILDVVYNHLGPEGNYLRDFGPYFTDRYRTPWGEAFNFDGEYSDGVRDYFIENALYWFEYFHVDALRLDAVHGIYDMSADHILRDLARAAGVFSRDCPAGRTYALIAESDLNDPRVVLNCHRGGYGIHAQWCDDFHHVLHALVTGERAGYYLDFGRAAQLPECLNHGFAYHGQYSGHRKRKHGGEACDIPMERFVYFVQNHDQVGNRMLGERLVSLCGADAARLAAACLLFMPGIPLLFMGEEYAESAPFQYFVSHGDPDLVRAVREGRKREFKAFGWENEPPDPQSVETFERSRLDWEKRSRPPHAAMLAFYRACLGLRRRWLDSGGAETEKPSASVLENDRTVIVERRLDNTRLLGLFHFDSHPAKGIRVPIDGAWTKILDGADSRFGGHNSGLPETIDSETALTLSSWQAAWFENKESPS